jgi:glycogen synthase
VTERVEFLGAVRQPELVQHYNAADALVLASSREGWANVLLESMACGTPVVASRVYGTPEVVAAPEAGVLMDERSPQGVAAAVAPCAPAIPTAPPPAATPSASAGTTPPPASWPSSRRWPTAGEQPAMRDVLIFLVIGILLMYKSPNGPPSA